MLDSKALNDPRTRRRLDSLMKQVFLSKPLQYTTMLSSELISKESSSPATDENTENHHTSNPDSAVINNHQGTTENDFKIDTKRVINDLENDRISPDQALDMANNLIENGKFESARQFIFSILPYLSTTEGMIQGEELEAPQQQTDGVDNTNSTTSRAYRLIGLSFYRNNEMRESLPWFRKAALNSNSLNDWFNLANTSAQIVSANNQPDSSFLRLATHAFSNIEKLHQINNFELKPSFWNQLYYFIIALMNGGHFNEAFDQLNRLKLAYKRARFTDKTYLQEIGLPSFDSFISLSLALFKRVGRLTQGIEFLEQLTQNVDDSGKLTIEKIIKEAQTTSDK